MAKVSVNLQKRREDWRKSASLDKTQFLRSVRKHGVISTEEAKEAAKGDIPDFLLSAFESLEDPDDAEIVWASTTSVRRNNELIEAIRVAKEMTEEEIDQIFGWEG